MGVLMKTAIVTDSTCYLTDQEIADNNITVVPIPVIIDGKIVTLSPPKTYSPSKSIKKALILLQRSFMNVYGLLNPFQVLLNHHWVK